MVLAVESGDTAFVMARDFYMPPPMQKLPEAVRGASIVTPAFVARISKTIPTDELIQFVTSDLDTHPKLRSVQACMVRTSITGGVAVMLDHGPVSANPVEAAARKLAEQMLQPGATRH